MISTPLRVGRNNAEQRTGPILGEDQGMGNLAYLQQRVHALESEIAQRKQIEESLRRSKVELESTLEQRASVLSHLSARLLSLQDVERRRIARELHDSLGQYLVGLKLNMDMVRQSPTRHDLWTEVDQLMQRCIAEVYLIFCIRRPWTRPGLFPQPVGSSRAMGSAVESK